MDTSHLTFKRILVIASVSLLGISSNAFATGFYVPYMSSVYVGEAGAGGAASADDASTNYYNPAGIVRFSHPQIVGAGTEVIGWTNYTGSSSAPGAAGLPPVISEYGHTRTHFNAMIPALHFVTPIPMDNRLFFGISMVAPFGLGYAYPYNSVIRYNIISAQLKTIDFSPSIAVKVNDKWSAAVGFDAITPSLHERYKVNTQPLTPGDSMTVLNVSGWGYGWHAGVLYQHTPYTRVGLSYHSQLIAYVSGTNDFTSPGVTPTKTNNLYGRYPLPGIAILSLYHDLTDVWTVLASMEYTRWRMHKNLHEFNVASLAGTVVSSVNVPQNYQDTWLYAIGGRYKINSQWLARAGLGFIAHNATNNIDRNMILPGGPYVGASAGAHYQATKQLGLDAGYQHVFYQQSAINFRDQVTAVHLSGNSNSSIDAFSAQVTWDFV